MIRATSINSYHQIKEEGLLSRRRFEVYDALVNFGPCTANELFREMRSRGLVGIKNQQTNLTPRLGELRDLGVVEEVVERICEITGRVVIVWGVVDRLPSKIQKPHRHKCLSCNGKGWSYVPKI